MLKCPAQTACRREVTKSDKFCYGNDCFLRSPGQVFKNEFGGLVGRALRATGRPAGRVGRPVGRAGPAGQSGRRQVGRPAIQRSPAVQPPGQPVGLSAGQWATCPAPGAVPGPGNVPSRVACGSACILPSHIGCVHLNLLANFWPIEIAAVLLKMCQFCI